MESHFGSRAVNIVLLSLSLGCQREQFLVKYSSARVTLNQPGGDRIVISGHTIHSGACVDHVRQQREGDNLTIVVTMVPVRAKCLAEFHTVVTLDPTLRRISLGEPGAKDAQSYGVIWSRDPRDPVYCPPVCGTASAHS